jgi:ferritin-like metal-binding protein YciE
MVRWLRDACAMETQAQTLLAAQVARLEGYPQARQRTEQYLRATVAHRARVLSCLTRLGSGPSLGKQMAAEMAAFTQVAVGMVTADEAGTSAVRIYALAHKAIAAYTALVAAAEASWDEKTRETCQQILSQKVEMARWLSGCLPETVTRYLSRPGANRNAKG